MSVVQETLLEGVQNISDKRKILGNGYSLEWVTEKILLVYRYGVLYKETEIKAGIDRRLLAVDLVLEAGVQKNKLAAGLGASRQSIDNWIDTFKKSGYEGLVNSYKGGKRKGRAENKEKLPQGNKARQLEQERRRQREARQEKQLGITLREEEIGDHESEAEIFHEEYAFEENRYAGGFLYWGIFQHVFDFMQLCESTLGIHATVIYLFAMMHVCGIGSIEQLKKVFKREFGKILGEKQLFSIPILWKKIHEVCELRKSKCLIERFFNRQARRGLVALTWLYLDGHFIPYYGIERIHKGYYTQRDQMMPGQTELFVHDSRGQIVYFELQEGKGDLKEMMIRMSAKWSSYIGGDSPLIIVDREGWGVEHFLSLKGYRFVTWEKFSRPEELASIAEKEFSDVFVINGKEYQAYEDQKRYWDNQGKSIELRRVVIWNRSSGRRMACVAQDDKEDTIGIACAMLGRWGCSENSFKHMGDRCNMHYNPVVDASKESGNQEVTNPDYIKVKKEIKQLKNQLNKCEQELGRVPVSMNQDGLVRKSKKRERLTADKTRLQEKLALAQKIKKSCPEKIRLDAVGQRKTLKELDTEGKNLWDLAESLVWNSRKKLIDLFGRFLPNPRDLIPILETITKSRGWVRSTRDAMEIRLEPLDVPRFKAAQIQLCRALNEKQIRLKNGKRLLYDVGECPTSKMSKN